MARKSRRQEAIANKRIEWRTAIYARLSIEDSGIKNNDSIAIQINLGRQYIEQRPYLTFIKAYVDNGSSGTNFERPEFVRLLDDIKRGRINCIVVKDLSRFGRNYIETCEYLDKIFPFMQVRFISVNDNIDSENKVNYTDDLIISLKNLINDAYAKDISRKVKSALKAQRERGEYTGSFAPYGYKKLKSNRSKLVPDEETAPVVQNIFTWRSEGMGLAAIAKQLEALNILCPSMRLRDKNIVNGGGYYKATIWQTKAIDRIISSKIYLGHMVQGKTSQALYDNKSQTALPESQWCIVENTHDPIVSCELWEAANNVHNDRRQEYLAKNFEQNLPENLFKGLLVCGTCSSKLVRTRSTKKNRAYYYYYCPLADQHKEGEYPHRIPARLVQDIVFSYIKIQIVLAGDIREIFRKREQQDEQIVAAIDSEIAQTMSTLQKLRKKWEIFYERYVDHLLTQDEFVGLKREYGQREKMYKQELEKLYQQKNVLTNKLAIRDAWLFIDNEFNGYKELSRNMLLSLVDKVIVTGHDNIEVVFKYKDQILWLI